MSVPQSWRDDFWPAMAQAAQRRAASSPARSSSSARPNASALRLKRRPSSTSPNRLVRRRGRCRSRRTVHHLGGDPGRGRGPGNGVPARRRARRSGGAAPRRGQEMRPLVENLARGRRRSAISRRHAARRPGTARMGRHAQGGGVGVFGGGRSTRRRGPQLYRGSLSAFGLVIAAIACALDQAANFGSWTPSISPAAAPCR